MRFANRRGKSGYDLDSMIPNLLSSDILKYPTSQNSEPTFKVDTHAMIPWCKFKNEDDEIQNWFDENSCELFQTVVTDLGMCYSFNAKPVQGKYFQNLSSYQTHRFIKFSIEMLRPSYFTDSFQEAFEKDLNGNKTYKGTESGHTLDFYLIGNKFRQIADKRITKSFKTNDKDTIMDLTSSDASITKFLLKITDRENYFGMKSSSKIVNAGYHITYNINAMEIVPSKDLHDIPIDKRRCRFYDEIQGM